MTVEDVNEFYRYMRTYYRNYKPGDSEAQDKKTLLIDFKDDSFDDVCTCFKKAISELKDPTFAPQFGHIRNKLDELYLERLKNSPRAKEAEFKEKHCGKTKKEWDEAIEWSQSEEGLRKFAEIMSKIKEMCERSEK